MSIVSAPTDSCPDWERDWPGRYGRELRELRAASVPFRVSDGQLAKGKLVIDLDWPNRGRIVRLRVFYPDGYPRLKPMVYLLGMDGDLPVRHCSPLNGELCLIGRDTKQWDTTWTLAWLLVRQLDAALNDGGEEDHQGEPLEVWWNGIAASQSRSFCLVDSAWAPAKPGPGVLSVRARLDGNAPALSIRACVVEVRDEGDGLIGGMACPVPDLDVTLRVPWVHLAEPFVPRSDGRIGAQVAALIRKHSKLLISPTQKLSANQKGRLIAFSYPQEVGHGRIGTGWAFFLFMGREWVEPGSKAACCSVQVLRAGPTDLVARHPRAVELLGKRVVLVGAGSIGAPLAAELVRNGCSDFHVVEPDISEPGNSMRWVGGHRAWGMRKGDALKALLTEIDPRCNVTVHTHLIGAPAEDLPDDGALVRKLLQGAAIVIDATASFGVIAWLGDMCRKAGVPFLAAMAFPGADDVAGGAVVLQAPHGACISCLEHARHRGEVPQPPGNAVEPQLQPPGCAERTFVGTAQDLREVALQAVRMVSTTLSADDTSLVASLAYEETLSVRLPRWRVDAFEAQPGCGCRSAR